ncbi:uncharacterized protein I206_107070 [Kwoniella pini CBS 10737]|uniref:Uncharacterized protein n=1 Tax=Kwoniella pini CBS 10737 TaxID=1296096 RepID=A0A1B9HZA6_9TREE|nr:uncharacterized protein I206_05386 [Kwoniella pini CBS 10737]OCF48606.1 hypothetical protein I206_05386 [Kwoniella pini CBS 10737]
MSRKKEVPQIGVRVTWPPLKILKLLETISSNELWIQTYFPKSDTQIKGKLKQSKKFCSIFMKDDSYMKELKRIDLVKKINYDDNWDITNWQISDGKDPIYDKIVTLKRQFHNGKLQEGFNLDPKWNSFDDIPNKSKRAKLYAKMPYYFLLKQLCTRSQDHSRQLIIPQDSILPVKSKRNKRSHSTSSGDFSSPNLESAFIQDHLDISSSPVIGPTKKKIRRTVPTSSTDLEQQESQAGETANFPMEINEEHISENPMVPLAAPHQTRSSRSPSIEWVFPTDDRLIGQPSKPRRSVIKNTIITPKPIIRGGFATVSEEAIEVGDDDTASQVKASQISSSEDEHSDWISREGSSPRSDGRIQDDRDAASSATAELNKHCSKEEVLEYLQQHSAIDEAAVQSLSLEELRDHVFLPNQSCGFLRPWADCLRRSFKPIMRKQARTEAGVAAIRRVIDNLGPKISYNILVGQHFVIPAGIRRDYATRRLADLIVDLGGSISYEEIQEELACLNNSVILLYNNTEISGERRINLLARSNAIREVYTWLSLTLDLCNRAVPPPTVLDVASSQAITTGRQYMLRLSPVAERLDFKELINVLQASELRTITSAYMHVDKSATKRMKKRLYTFGQNAGFTQERNREAFDEISSGRRKREQIATFSFVMIESNTSKPHVSTDRMEGRIRVMSPLGFLRYLLELKQAKESQLAFQNS